MAFADAIGMPSSAPLGPVRVRAHLKRIFGLKHLRPGQDEVIRHVLEGRDTLALMATGAGKSLCYQLPATLLPGRTLVVSPLIALMKDQCDKLRAMGVDAVRFDSAQSASEHEAAQRAVRDGTARIIITTPEQLSNPSFIGDVSRHPVSLLVVDEAHCVTQWGHGFRPAFLEIGASLRRLGHPVVLALTATATDQVAQDVMAQLELPGMRVVNTGMYRPNLHHAVDLVNSEEGKNARLLTLLQSCKGQGIVYTSTVKAAVQVHDMLVGAGEAAMLYHGRLAAGRRRDSQNAYMSGEARIMVATQAFGLGIDKADTRFVIHYQMPPSLESYYQEAGRAGRDGEAAQCTLLYLSKDKAIQQFFLTGRYPTLEDLSALQSQLLKPPPEGLQGWTQPDLIAAIDRPKSKVGMALHLLRQQGVVTGDAGGPVRLSDAAARAPLDDEALQAMLEGYAQRKRQDRDMLESMVFYCQSGLCRWKMILDHFDQADGFQRCGQCDNCVRMRQAEDAARQMAPADGGSSALSEEKDNGGPAPAGPNLNVDDAVRVPRYGRGRISALDGEGVTVRFPDGQERCFLAAYVTPMRTRGARGAGQPLPTSLVGDR